MTTNTTVNNSLEVLKQTILEARKVAITEKVLMKEKMQLEVELGVITDKKLQKAKLLHELTVEEVIELKVRMELAATAVDEARLTSSRGKAISLNFFNGRHPSIVVSTLIGLLNGLVNTREDASIAGALAIGLNEVDITSYRESLGSSETLDESTGVVYPGHVGDAVALAINVQIIADKLGVSLPNGVTFNQSDLDNSYQYSVDKVEKLILERSKAESEWDKDNGGLNVVL